MDWNLIEEIVKYYYCKQNPSYNIKQLLIDLISNNVQKILQYTEMIKLLNDGDDDNIIDKIKNNLD